MTLIMGHPLFAAAEGENCTRPFTARERERKTLSLC